MKTKILCALLLPAVAVGGFCLLSGKARLSLPSPSLKEAALVALAVAASTASHEPGAPVAAVATSTLDLADGLRQGVLKAEIGGNGRDAARVRVSNPGDVVRNVRVTPGQIFLNDRNSVIVVRPVLLALAPGKTGEMALQTAALRSGNKIAEAAYRITLNPAPKLDPLLSYIQDHPELTPGAIQTAVLAVTENLPLSAVAKFNSVGGQLRSRFDTTAFRAETADIVAALLALRETGRKDADVAMSIDPQLKIEAMIDPQARPAAMRYYDLTAGTEWEYWKNELADGDPATRHYALYGIARYFPDVALDMLPKWAREVRTSAPLRRSAIQALADTQRTEALTILRQLADELGRYTELGRAAATSAQHLDTHLTRAAGRQTAAVTLGAATPGAF
jgi:hypothetical protein